MNKAIILLLIICLLFVHSCSSIIRDENNTTHTNESTTNCADEFKFSDAPLGELLTVSYDINELDSFFIPRSYNEMLIRDDNDTDKELLTIYEVNESFPVEVLREGEYSVYKVKQGGYYYVFWIFSTGNTSSITIDEESLKNFHRVVGNVLYISSDKTVDDISTKISSGDTLLELHKLDKYVFLNVLLSHGQYAYSFVDKDTVIEFKLTNEHGHYLINSIDKLSRKDTSCGFGCIFEQDFLP